MPRKERLPFFSTSIVNLTEMWVLLRVCRKVVAVVKSGITVSVSSTYRPGKRMEVFLVAKRLCGLYARTLTHTLHTCGWA